MHRSFLLRSVSTHLVSKDFCIETPEEDQFLIKICRIYKDNKGLCLTEIYFFTYLYTHEGMADIQLMYNLIPIPCNSGASSIPLCYVLFPATLLHRLFFYPPSLHLAIYFLAYPSIMLFPNSYTILFWEFYFLPFSVHVQTKVIYLMWYKYC